ncbi:unnamed protein product [Scytosiphon promiscuus]
MVAGSVTSAHVDSQLVQGEEFFLPAAGIMQCADRKEYGPAKRAVVICAHDMSRVVDVLRLNTSYPSAGSVQRARVRCGWTREQAERKQHQVRGVRFSARMFLRNPLALRPNVRHPSLGGVVYLAPSTIEEQFRAACHR